MLRIVFILLILGGLAAAALGGGAMFLGASDELAEPGIGTDDASESAPAPTPRSIAPSFDGEEPTLGPAAMERNARARGALADLPIAYETPEQAVFGEVFDVVLSIDATGARAPEAALPGRERTRSAEVRLGDQAKAQLTGSAFRIVDLSPETQSLSDLTQNTWRWEVTPLAAGERDLVLEIFAVSGDAVLPVRTYRDTIGVEVSRVRQIVALAEEANPLAMLLGGLGSVLAGLFGAARFFSRS